LPIILHLLQKMRYTLLLLSILILTACRQEEETVDYTAQNDAEIQTYLAANNLNAQSTGSGLYYLIDSVGSGANPTSTDDVTVAYKGYFTNGNVFDESDANGISFNLQGVIKGWTEGIPYFKEGGSGQLFIPAHLGYGSQGRGSIPGGAVLIFDIRLITID
jgi:FKBP-type peptidyl-prolyl cis-trans isomerase FkpA